ncbi:MAG: TIGR04255 family protein [Chloroflexota bacterium]
MTSVRRRYTKPPVVEALAELYFEGATWSVTAPGSFYGRVENRFPKEQQQEQVAFEVSLGPGVANARMGSSGGRAVFKSEDETQLVQVGPDALVVNQLQPYPHFEAWRDVLLEMLAIYREVARPKAVSRLGMRYINRIEIEQVYLQMEELFRVYPEMPEEIGLAHGDFLIRLQLPAKVQGHTVLLTLGKAPVETPSIQAFVLDLYDVIPLGGTDSFDMVAQHLNDAHENIEWIFEHTITDATRAIFGEVIDDLG